jgi:phage terminase small subunit
MAESNEEKPFSWVDWDGRRHVDLSLLLKDPKVKQTIRRLSKVNERYRNQPGVTFLRRVKPEA